MASGVWPAYLASAGLGSNVSTCEGPPFIKRKITRLARAGKCGGFGSRVWLGPVPGAEAEEASPIADDTNPPSDSTLERASAPKPPPSRQSMSRRGKKGLR